MMKSLFMGALLCVSSFSFANTEATLTETLETALRFDGYVEISEITKADAYTVVEFYVGSYGDERPTTCVFKYDKLIDCKDNWFKY